MRTVQLSTAAAILGTMAFIAGCGHTGPGASGAAGAGGSSSPAAGSAPSGSTPAGAIMVSGKSLTLDSEQNGKVYDVQVGTNVFIYLRGTPSQMWKTIQASSDALQPSASGRLALMMGETGASFTAAKAGTAIISSTRPLCSSSGSSGGTASPGGVASCGVIESYHVTVVVG